MDKGVSVIEASGGVLVRNEDDDGLEVLGARGFNPSVLERITHDREGPLGGAIRTAEPIWFESMAEVRRRFATPGGNAPQQTRVVDVEIGDITQCVRAAGLNAAASSMLRLNQCPISPAGACGRSCASTQTDSLRGTYHGQHRERQFEEGVHSRTRRL